MGKIITIEVPDDIYAPFEEITKKKTNQEVSDEITKMLKELINDKLQRFNDPIFQPISKKGSGISNVSEKHDEYLYG